MYEIETNQFRMRYLFQQNQLIKKITFLLFFFSSAMLYSQDYSVGLKGGASYSFNDNGAEIKFNGERFSAESDFGYLGGAFLEVNFKKWLVRPEVFINRAQGEFIFSESNAIYNLDKISLPLLLGYNIYGLLDIYAGPVYQFILDKRLENTAAPLDDGHSNLAAQAGFKFSFNRLEIDFRYDFTLPSEDFQRVNLSNGFNNAYFDEGRLNQLMLCINYKIFGSNIKSTRRGGNCY